MDQHTEESQQQPQSREADDNGRINVDGFLRIWDPETQETLVETRA